MRRLTILLATVAVVAAAPALAVDGQIPIPNTTVYATPIVITAPGSYVVTRNLTPTAPGPIIDISVPALPGGNVELDLNGHLLDNSANPADPVIRVTIGAGTHEVAIREGSLVGGSGGVEAIGPARKLVIEDVDISEFTASGPALAGIYTFDVLSVAIRRCAIHDTTAVCGGGVAGAGIWLDGGVLREATIEDNLIRRTCEGITVLAGQSVEISNNRLHDILPGLFGAAMTLDFNRACLVSQNTINTVVGPPGTSGIFLRSSSGCKLYNNLIDNTSFYGIHIDLNSFDNMILNNVVRAAADDGIRIDGDGNHIERNALNANGLSGTGFGLHLTAGAIENTYSRNSGFANVGPPAVCLFPFTPEFCDDNSLPPGPPNGSLFDNMMPPSGGPF